MTFYNTVARLFAHTVLNHPRLERKKSKHKTAEVENKNYHNEKKNKEAHNIREHKNNKRK